MMCRVGDSLASLELDLKPLKETVSEFLHAHDPEEAKAKADKFLEVLTMAIQRRMKQLSLSLKRSRCLLETLMNENRDWEMRLVRLEGGQQEGVKFTKKAPLCRKGQHGCRPDDQQKLNEPSRYRYLIWNLQSLPG